MANTLNYGFPKPDTAKNIDEEFYVFRDTTLDMIDAAIKSVADAAASKSAIGHGHAIGEVAGLAAALESKMPASQTFSLDSLTDVDGATAAAVGQILWKTSAGWLPTSALAALGPHGHLISEVTGLGDALTAKAEKATVLTAGTGLSGGGDLSAGRTISADIATQAEAQAGISNAKLMTPVRAREAALAYNRWETIRDVDLAGVTALNVPDLSAFRTVKITGNAKPVTNGAGLFMQGSTDNGSSWLSGIYTEHYIRAVENTPGGSLSGGMAAILLINDISSVWEGGFEATFTNFNKASAKFRGGWCAYVSSAGANVAGAFHGRLGTAAAAAWNALRIYCSSGAFSTGYIHIEGIRG